MEVLVIALLVFFIGAALLLLIIHRAVTAEHAAYTAGLEEPHALDEPSGSAAATAAHQEGGASRPEEAGGSRAPGGPG
jgi:hypothetical protein